MGENLPWLCLPQTPELSKADTTSTGTPDPWRNGSCCSWCHLLNVHLTCSESSDFSPVAEGSPDRLVVLRYHLGMSWARRGDPAHNWAEITSGNRENTDAFGVMMVSIRKGIYCWRSASAGACLVSEKLSYLAMQVDITNKACFSWQQTAINWCNYLQ